MGKTTKNDSGSGGDERIVESKSRAGSNPLKASSSTVKRLSENESSRLKTGIRQSARQSISGKISLKQPTNVTVHTPIKPLPGLGQPTNRAATNTAKPIIFSNNKEIKTKGQAAKMKQESENSDNKATSDIQEVFTTISESPSKQQVKDNTNHQENQPTGHHKNGLSTIDEVVVEENGFNGKSNGKASEHNGKGTSSEPDDFVLHLDSNDQGNNKFEEDTPPKTSSEGSKDDSQSDTKTSTDNCPTDTDSCSVDIVESTTSEFSETSESTASFETKNKEIQDEIINEGTSSDASKQKCSVQLTDCMKDPQVEEEGNAQSSDSENMKPKFLSNLKSVKARRSIRRNLTYHPQSSDDSLLVKVSTDVGGPSDQCQNLLAESDTTSTNGVANPNCKLNLKRKATECFSKSDDNELKLKDDCMQNTIENDKSEQEQKTEVENPAKRRRFGSVYDFPIAKKWCTIM